MNIELLAPAGSYESLVAAIHAGADAIYIGGNKFGARAFANNLDSDKLKEAIDYAHLHGCKLYLTVNTLIKEEEFTEELFEYINQYYQHGIDAVIVQDMGVLSFIRKQFPDLAVHASTQMTITGADGAKFLESLGVSRVVTSRELSLEEISSIHSETSLEIECFVHGALCYCYSGQCLYSSLLGGRSGNRGRCAQPCRLSYDVLREGKKINKKEEGYVLSPKDICTLDIIPELVRSGITSFKIEGRMKKPEYTAGVVRIYRKYLDLYLKEGNDGYHIREEDHRELLDLYNRGGFSKGYYVQKNGKSMISLTRPNHLGTKAAKVLRADKDNIILQALEALNAGDVLEFRKRNGKDKCDYACPSKVSDREKFTLQVNNISGKIDYSKSDKKKKENGLIPYEKGQFIYRTRDVRLLKELKAAYVDSQSQEKINGKLILLKDIPVILEINFGEIQVIVEGDIPTLAQNQPLTKEKLSKQLRKTGNTPFIFDKLEMELDDNLFLSMQSLNHIRRKALEELEVKITSVYRREAVELINLSNIQVKNNKLHASMGVREVSVYVEKLAYLESLISLEGIRTFYIDCTAIQLPFGNSALREYLKQCKSYNKKCFFVFPHIFRKETRDLYRERWNEFLTLDFEGVLIKNMETFQFLQDMGYEGNLVLDHNVYTFNNYGKQFWNDKHISYWTAPLELNYKELKQLGCDHCELIVYGYLPMMVSAQCIKHTISGCDHKPEELYLKDRLQKEFCVKNNCDFCSNTIYNSERLVLLDQYREIVSLNVPRIRLHFTIEEVQEVKKITMSFIDRFMNQNSSDFEKKNFTRGHFKRGIE